MRRVAYTYCFTLIRSFIIYLFSETENARALSCLWPRTLNICNRYDAPSTSRWLLFFFFSFLLFFRFSPLVSPLLSILRDGFVLFLHLLLIRSRSSYRYFFSLFHVFAACTNRRVFLFNDLQIDSLLNLSNIVMYYLSRYREVVCAVNQFSFFFFDILKMKVRKNLQPWLFVYFLIVWFFVAYVCQTLELLIER